MKGFGIHIKNDLLEPKHVRAMGVSVWLYMWLLDKITSITEDGKGRILGGQPVKYEMVAQDLPISIPTYDRWIDLLRSGGYIVTSKAPYGLVISVNKAVKPSVRKSSIKSDRAIKSDSSSIKNGHSSIKNDGANKTTQDISEDKKVSPNPKSVEKGMAMIKRIRKTRKERNQPKMYQKTP